MDQAAIDKRNAEFWNDLCGSHLAQNLGITDHSAESLQRFDDAFFATYPYFLPEIIRPARLADQDVLEVGLGFGSLSQQIAKAGARYTGLDIAAGAVRMVNHRLAIQGRAGMAIQGSALEMPFPSESFDFVISIGCFHHTGNTQRCFDEARRVLRPGGTAIMMVYNKFSARQWIRWPFFTFKELLRAWGVLQSRERATDAQRLFADANLAGQAAPETAFLCQRELRQMLQGFEHVTLQKQNVDDIALPHRRLGRLIGLNMPPRKIVLIDRLRMLSTVGRVMGLDVYIEAKKAAAPATSSVLMPPTVSAAA